MRVLRPCSFMPAAKFASRSLRKPRTRLSKEIAATVALTERDLIARWMSALPSARRTAAEIMLVACFRLVWANPTTIMANNGREQHRLRQCDRLEEVELTPRGCW